MGLDDQPILAEVFDKKIWIESDFLGSRCVMVQHEGCEPFQYCAFFYDYRYTSNAEIHQAADNMAKSLGAKHPVKEVLRKPPTHLTT